MAHHTDSTDLECALAQHHRSVERALEELLVRARRREPEQVREAFRVLDAELREHLTLEEDRLFPRLARSSPLEEARLRRDHDLIRERLDGLGVATDLRALRPSALEEFVRLLRDHAAVESKKLYDWSADALSEREAWPVLDWIRLRHASHSERPTAQPAELARGKRRRGLLAP